MKLGNGIETRYNYREDNRRLKNLNSEGALAGKFQNLDYTYDRVGNITDLKNQVAIPAPNSFGGPTTQHFDYDDLYRLTHAHGDFKSNADASQNPGKVRDYTLDMGYSDIHNITGKVQTDTITTPDGSRIPQKATSYDHGVYTYAGDQPHAPTHIGSHTYSYDANGNQLGWLDDKSGARRIIRWDEDNRIAEILDNGHSSKYTYDDKGQRVIKETKQGETVYVNQYYVVRNRSIVSKHLFAGSSRLVTRLEMGTAPGNEFQGSGSNPTSFNTTTTSGNSNGQGSGKDHGNQGNAYAYGQSKDNPGQGATKGNAGQEHGNGNTQGKANSGSHGNAGENTTNLPGNSEKGLENALANGKGNKYGIYKHLAKEGYTVDASGDIVIEAGEGGATPITGDTAAPVANGQSEFTYYYHPDHLGSTGYLTDASGKLYEHIEYFPFGETWVQEHSNTLRTPYLFTGKEYDQETELYYFGARYYDPRTSVWQSADPILEKYLPNAGKTESGKLAGIGGVYNSFNLGLYAYSQHDPLVYRDPDGRETFRAVRDLNHPLALLGSHGFVAIITDGPSKYGRHADMFQPYTNTTGNVPGVEKGKQFFVAMLTGTGRNDGSYVKEGQNDNVNPGDVRAMNELSGGTSLFKPDLDLSMNKVNPKEGKSTFDMEMGILDGFASLSDNNGLQYGAFAGGDKRNCFSLQRSLLEKGGADLGGWTGDLSKIDPGTNTRIPDQYFEPVQ